MAMVVPIDRPLNPNVTVELKVRVTRKFRLRLWLAERLFTLGVRVLGGKPKVEIEVE